jgi:hypothetical protein
MKINGVMESLASQMSPTITTYTSSMLTNEIHFLIAACLLLKDSTLPSGQGKFDVKQIDFQSLKIGKSITFSYQNTAHFTSTNNGQYSHSKTSQFRRHSLSLI